MVASTLGTGKMTICVVMFVRVVSEPDRGSNPRGPRPAFAVRPLSIARPSSTVITNGRLSSMKRPTLSRPIKYGGTWRKIFHHRVDFPPPKDHPISLRRRVPQDRSHRGPGDTNRKPRQWMKARHRSRDAARRADQSSWNVIVGSTKRSIAAMPST